MNLLKFAENLDALMFDNGRMNGKQLASAIGVSAPTVTQYLQMKHVPSVKNLLLLADYFHCSTDFLLGREEETRKITFRPCPPFSQQIVFLTKYFKMTYYRFYRSVKIPEATFFEWKTGTSVPSLENVVKIAEHFNCRVDFILGRE